MKPVWSDRTLGLVTGKINMICKGCAGRIGQILRLWRSPQTGFTVEGKNQQKIKPFILLSGEHWLQWQENISRL